MTNFIWILAKPGDDRLFCSPRQYDPNLVKLQRKKGYRLFRLPFMLPEDFKPDYEDLTNNAVLEEVND